MFRAERNQPQRLCRKEATRYARLSRGEAAAARALPIAALRRRSAQERFVQAAVHGDDLAGGFAEALRDQ